KETGIFANAAPSPTASSPDCGRPQNSGRAPPTSGRQSIPGERRPGWRSSAPRLPCPLAGKSVLDGSPQLDRFRQRSLLQLLAHLLDVATEVLPQNLVHRQVSVHAVDAGKGPQRPSKNQSVKPRKESRNHLGVRRYTLAWRFGSCSDTWHLAK